jgi:autophagy-related protein 18
MRLLIASAEGYVYVYEVNPVEGGDCTLLKQHR